MAEWLEHMPWIPPAGGVPVRCPDGHQRVCVGYDPKYEIIGICPGVHGVEYVRGEEARAVRVDLGDPLGFAYALRYARNLRWNLDLQIAWSETRWRDLALGDDMTTDADRLALAKALKEVTNG